MTLIDFAPEQNDCAFGSVDKAEFKRMLNRAKGQSWTVWPHLAGFPEPLQGPLLRAAVEDLGHAVPTSADKQLAAAHALMRSMQAQYYQFSDIRDFEKGGKLVSTSNNFSYFLSQRRFSPWCLACFYWRYATIDVSFYHDVRTNEYTLASVTILHPDIKYRPEPSKGRNISSACPYFYSHYKQASPEPEMTKGKTE